MSLEAVLGFASNAAAMRHESETPMRGHTATCCREAELAGLAAAVLDWLRTELAAEGMRRHVTDALVRANNDDCDGYLPLTEADIQTLSVTYEDDATAALEAVAERLAGGER